MNAPDGRVIKAALAHAPCYVYETGVVRARVREAASLVDRYLYPLKANPELDVVRAALDAGAALDLCSRGDLDIAVAVDAALSSCSFTSPSLDTTLAAELVARDVHVDLDSLGQVESWLSAGGRDCGLRVCTADASSAYGSKFGMLPPALAQAATRIARGGGMVRALHLHDAHAARSSEAMADRLLAVLEAVPAELVTSCARINVGGGWPMTDGTPVEAARLAPALTRLRSRLSDRGFSGELVAEPGEWVVGACGWLAARVAGVKPHPVNASTVVVVLDTATPVPCRPTRSPFVIVRDDAVVLGATNVLCDVYGSANTGLDTIGLGVATAAPREGDLVIVGDQGAYARQLTGSFNERIPPAAVVLD